MMTILPIRTIVASPLQIYHDSPSTYGKPVELSLKDAIFLALRYNPNIQSAEVERVSQKFNVRVAENAFELNYALNGTANILNQVQNGERQPFSQNYSLEPSASLLTHTGTQFQLSMQNNSNGEYYNPGITFSVTQPILRGSNPAAVLAPLHNAYDQEIINQIQLRSDIINTVVLVITDYRDVISAEQSLKIDLESLKRAERNYQSTAKFIEAGQKPRMDLAQAKLTVTQNKITILNDQDVLASAKQRLLLDLGMDPSMRIRIQKSIHVIKYKVPNINKATAIALKNSPTYQQDLLNLRIDRRNLILSQDNARWSLNANYTSTWGNGSGGFPNNNLRSIFNGLNNSQAASVTLNVPINDVTNQQAIIDARVAVRQQEIETAFERDSVRTDVINLIRQLKIDYLRLQASIEAEQLQAINLKNAYIQFQAGQLDSLSVSQQQDTLTQSQQTVLANQITYLNDVTAFRQLLQQTLVYWKIKVNF